MSMLSRLITRANDWLDELDESNHHILYAELYKETDGCFMFSVHIFPAADEGSMVTRAVTIPVETVVTLCLTGDVYQFCELLGYKP